MPLHFLLLHLLITLPATTTAAATTTTTTTPHDCPTSCGNLTIPFPFGTQPGCHLPGFFLTCNSTFSPPRAFLGSLRVTSLSLNASTVSILTYFALHCNTPLAVAPNIPGIWLDLTNYPFAISNTRNKFTALGCSTLALNYHKAQYGNNYTTGCVSICDELSSVINGSCSGIGCCQTAIPRGLQRIDITFQNIIGSPRNFSPCSYAFLIDHEQYIFKVSDLGDFYKRDRVPVVLDWAVGNNETCEAAATSASYLCGDNTYCTDSTNAVGYHCSCQSGYDGNPYIANGCKDINECEDAQINSCSDICENTAGSYVCSCPKGYTGDGKKAGTGSGCNKQAAKFPFVQVVAGCGLGLLLLLLALFILYYLLKKRRMLHLKEKFFKQNGGLLLQQQLYAHEGLAETARIFTAEELRCATDNYADSRILGHGGNGTVYKGILPDTGRVVAIKKSHFVEATPTQIEQFINEVVLLSQVIHKNVVRILGCCLETQVPLLVYEYVPNGTLEYHLHGRSASLPWLERLRVASETAGALAYLHSAIARPIFHRDVKAANILLDHNYMAKVSDFGASRLVPLDRAEITTLVTGTLGYLDPEYFHTGQLTEKSDVYSFGVILAEMMTGQKPLSSERTQAEMNLAIYFLLKIKDGKLQEILEPGMKKEGKEQVEVIAELARRCLRLKGEERPTMREVAAEIERVRRPENNVWEKGVMAAVEEDGEEEEHRLLGGVMENNGSVEELSMATRFYSRRVARMLSSEKETGMRYFPASATGDESLNQHILWSLEMQS